MWRDFPPRSKPREARGGIKAQSREGGFGKSWWARRWQSLLDSFRLSGRLARGRNYARQGQVLSIDVAPGKVTASVQGSRPRPYDVTIGVKVLSPRQWDHLLEVLAGQALFVAKLLAGEMPQDIEEVFQRAHLSLFPQKRGDLKTDCSCPDDANPCKHIAAVYYLLGEEFDRDPFLIFRLRGLEREQLLARLTKRSSQGQHRASGRAARPGSPPAAEAAPAVEPLPADPTTFWAMGPLAEDYGEVQAPPVSAGLVRRLGKFPFWRGERPLVDAVEPAYVEAAALGLSTFLGEWKKAE